MEESKSKRKFCKTSALFKHLSILAKYIMIFIYSKLTFTKNRHRDLTTSFEHKNLKDSGIQEYFTMPVTVKTVICDFPWDHPNKVSYVLESFNPGP